MPLLGLVAFMLNICFFLHDEQLDLNEFKERFDVDFVEEWESGVASDLKSPATNEMQKLSTNQVADVQAAEV